MTTVLSFEEWLDANPNARDIESPCPACEGRGYWVAVNDWGQSQNVVCTECDGTGHMSPRDAALETYATLRDREMQLINQWQG